MLSKCANPECLEPFRKLQEGKLFLTELGPAAVLLGARGAQSRVSRRLEYYWLCEQCASALTLTFEPARGVVAVPLAQPTGKMAAVAVRSSGVTGIALGAAHERAQAASGGSHEA